MSQPDDPVKQAALRDPNGPARQGEINLNPSSLSGTEPSSTLTLDQLRANSLNVRQTPYGLQDGNGVDVTLIDSMLKTPLTERFRINDQFALAFERMHGRVRS